MKGGIFTSIYVLVFAASLTVFLPVAFWLSRQEEAALTAQRRSLTTESALRVLHRIARNPLTALPPNLPDEFKPAIQTANAVQKEFQFLNAAVYERLQTAENGDVTFRLSEKYFDNILNAPPDLIHVSKDELAAPGRFGDLVSQFWIRVPDSAGPAHLIVVGFRDLNQQQILGSGRTAFWIGAAMIFVVFYTALGTALYWIVKKPLNRLQSALLSKEDRIEQLSPEEFGDLGDLVSALQTYVDRTRSFVATAENVDPVTGLMSGQTAVTAYLESHRRPDEVYAVFFRANFAKEYVKAFGRANRDRILKIAGSAVALGLPPGARLYAVQDHFFMTFLTGDAFRRCYASIQANFNKSIRALYDPAAGKDAPVMTLSAAGISNKSGGYETFHETMQKLHDHWESLVNKPLGGWALMDADDQWVKGDTQEEGAASAEEEIVPEEPESLKDPGFARKVFIVKLAFMFQFDPKKSAKLYQLGYTRLPALLAEEVPDAVKKYGLDGEVRVLAEKMRLVPKRRLYFTESDFKQVFVTDVRMIRKIPREVAGRWFAAGFRRVDDLADLTPEDLLAIDRTAALEDVRAIVQKAQTLRRAGSPAAKA